MNNSRMDTAVGKLGRVVVVRLKPGTDVLAGLAEACEEYGISNGVILSAIGLYQPIADWGGAGATVPLTGFGYALAKGVRLAFIQEGGTAEESFIPPFDLTGVQLD